MLTRNYRGQGNLGVRSNGDPHLTHHVGAGLYGGVYIRLALLQSDSGAVIICRAVTRCKNEGDLED